ncbi:MAG: DUF1361 domain-containing protein [Actinobacteria bacterium]|nr:DUF1361 domain-containing protein [Actinomycetota bacterium]
MRLRALLPFAALLGATLWCVLLLGLRRSEYGPSGLGFLVWNLTLAWIPLALAVLLLVAYRRQHPRLELVALGAAWFVFLPNAPYMLTDLIHLGDQHRLFDALILGSFAITALALGFASLLIVQLVVTRAAGAALGWLVAIGSLCAASVGIYLGRVQRLNSWDVIHRPGYIVDLARMRFDDPFGNRQLIGYVVALSVFLTLAYAALYGFAALMGTARPEPQR